MADLEYNIRDLTAQAKQLRNISDSLRETRNQLSTAFSVLRAEWQTDAGNAFFENYDVDWEAQLEAYCNLISELAVCLDNAASEYGPLEEKYNQIRFE